MRHKKIKTRRWYKSWRVRAVTVFLLVVLVVGIFNLGTAPDKVSAAISLVNTSTNIGNNVNSLSVTKPSGVVSGTLMIAHVSFYNGRSTTVTAPSGWSQVGGQIVTSSRYMDVYYKVAGASEPTSYSWSFSRSSYINIGISAFSGENTTAPIDASGSQLDTTNSTALNAPSINMVSNNDMLVSMWGYGRQETANSFSAGLTSLLSTSTTNLGISDAYELMSASGTSGTTTSNVTTATVATAFNVAIKPASAAAGVTLVGGGTPATCTSCTSLTESVPTGYSVGDFLITDISLGNGNTITGAPSGWTLIDTAQTAGNYTQYDYYHWVASGDPSSYTWSFSGSGGGIVATVDFSGVDPSNPIDVSAQQSDGNSTSHNSPSVTTNYAEDVLFPIWTYEYGILASTHTSSLSQVWSVENASGNNRIGIFSGYETLGVAGASGTRNTTIGSNRSAMMHTIAIKPYLPTPTLFTPADGSTDQHLSPVFTLKNISLTSSPLQYRINICADSACSTVLYTYDQTTSQTGWSGQDQLSGTAYTGSTILDNSTMATFTLPVTLTAGTQYWWDARSYDTGTGQYSLLSNIATFTTSYVPAAPTLFSPPNGANGISVTPEFQLASTDTDGDNLMYKVQLCSNSSCTSILDTFDQTASQSGWSGQDSDNFTDYASDPTSASVSTTAFYDYTGTPLIPTTTYYWRAYAIDPGGSDTWSTASSIYAFTVNPTEVRILNGQIMSGTIE